MRMWFHDVDTRAHCLQHPGEEKYSSVRLSNEVLVALLWHCAVAIIFIVWCVCALCLQTFKARVSSLVGGLAALRAAGFQRNVEKDTLVCNYCSVFCCICMMDSVVRQSMRGSMPVASLSCVPSYAVVSAAFCGFVIASHMPLFAFASSSCTGVFFVCFKDMVR